MALNLASMLLIRLQAVLMRSEVLQSGQGVHPLNVENQLHSTCQRGATALHFALPLVLVSPVGILWHMCSCSFAKLIFSHVLFLVQLWCQVMGIKVGGQVLRVPWDIFIADLIKLAWNSDWNYNALPDMYEQHCCVRLYSSSLKWVYQCWPKQSSGSTHQERGHGFLYVPTNYW